MNCFKIEILHSIRGRLRLRFENGIKDPQKVFKILNATGGVKSLEYNPLLRTATIHYSNFLTLDRVLLQCIVSCVYGQKSGEVELIDKRKNAVSPRPSSQGVALMMSVVNIFANVFGSSVMLSQIIKWLTVSITGYAIIDHGYRELKEKGAFDPEVMSIVYLFDAINNGVCYAPAIAWVLTFGRHIISSNSGKIAFRVEQHEGNSEKYLLEPKRALISSKLLDDRYPALLGDDEDTAQANKLIVSTV